MKTPSRSLQPPGMVTMRLLGSLELCLANTFLPLLLLTWLSVGTVSLQAEPDTAVQCKMSSENLTAQVNCYKPECLDSVVLVENSMNFNISSMCTACREISVCRVSMPRTNSTDTGIITQIALLGENCMNFSISAMCSACTETCVCTISVTRPNSTDTGIITALNLLCILLGLAVGTLLHMPVICFLLWQRTRNRTGELLSEEVPEENQTSTAAPVTETEDLTYANLNFENKGTGPTSSNVIYTEIKPLQQKQSGGEGSAASDDVNACPKEEGK